MLLNLWRQFEETLSCPVISIKSSPGRNQFLSLVLKNLTGLHRRALISPRPGTSVTNWNTGCEPDLVILGQRLNEGKSLQPASEILQKIPEEGSNFQQQINGHGSGITHYQLQLSYCCGGVKSSLLNHTPVFSSASPFFSLVQNDLLHGRK